MCLPALPGQKKSPIVAKSEKELKGMLVHWINKHPGISPPGLVKISKAILNRSRARGFMLSDNLKRVLLNHYPINDIWMSWILTKSNGSCMLAKPWMGNSWSSRSWHAWLGGNLGFTIDIVAHNKGTINVKLKKRAALFQS